jgi:hypothetical protein
MEVNDVQGIETPSFVKQAIGAENEPLLVNEESQEVKQEEKSPLQELAELLYGEEKAPTLIDLEGWKDLYGSINASSVLGDDNIYIWRTLRRVEYKMIAETGAMNDENRYQDAVLRKGLLWPEPATDRLRNEPAGVIPTIFKQLMYKSGFVPEEMAIALINTI